MSVITKAKLIAEIAEIGSRIYGLIQDKGREKQEREAKIKDLERQLAEAKAKLKEQP